MKSLKLLGMAVLLGLTAIFQSCDDNDGYSIGDIGRDYVTVHVTGDNGYTFTGDTWGTIWPAASAVFGYHPTEGQRALLYFNPLYDDFHGYDVAVKVEDIYPILTKTVEQLTAENETEYGDDPASITDAWIGGGYLNLIFVQHVPASKPHRVSLVENTMKSYEDDGYVHLEYRYNTYGDTLNNAVVRSMVSYNLNTISMVGKKGLKLRINSSVNGERVLDFTSNYQPQSDDIKDLDLTSNYSK